MSVIDDIAENDFVIAAFDKSLIEIEHRKQALH